MNRKLEHVILPSATSTSRNDILQGMQAMTWDEMVASYFQTYKERRSKGGPCIIPAEYLPSKNWRINERSGSARLDINVARLNLLFLDLDTEGAIDKARRLFSGVSHIIHRTWSWTEEKPWKHRLIAPLAESIEADDWRNACLGMVTAVSADPACQNESRIYFLPTKPRNVHWHGPIERSFGPWINRDFLAEHAPSDGGKKRRIRKSANGQKNKKRSFKVVSDKALTAFTLTPAPDRRLGWPEGAAGFAAQDIDMRCRRALAVLKETDSRHNFALKATMRAVSHPFGAPNAQRPEKLIACMTAWMIAQAEKHGSHAMAEGNTIEELPEMFASAYAQCRQLAIDVEEIEAWVLHGVKCHAAGIHPGEPHISGAASPWGARYDLDALLPNRTKLPKPSLAQLTEIVNREIKMYGHVEPLPILVAAYRWAVESIQDKVDRHQDNEHQKADQKHGENHNEKERESEKEKRDEKRDRNNREHVTAYAFCQGAAVHFDRQENGSVRWAQALEHIDQFVRHAATKRRAPDEGAVRP